MKSVDKLAEILQKERKRKKMHRIVSGMAALVVFITTYVLILPAATLENKALCGLAEHTHSAACYETKLVCTQEETESTHEHTDACYVSEQVLSCTKPEGEGHTHSDACYGLTCGQSEGEGHTHSDSCYTTTTELTCSQTESSGHSHSDSCYDADGNLTCSESESAGHTHSDSCYTQNTVCTCGQTESAGHTHSDSCYGLTCSQAETEAHTHNESCYTTNKTLVCTEPQGHKHSDSCYEKVLICNVSEHTHTDACYENKTEEKPVLPDIPQTLPEIIDDLLCTISEHTHSDTCYDADGNLICTLTEHTHTDDCYNQTTIPEEQIPQEDLPLMAFPDSLPEGYTEYTFSDENGLSVLVYAPEDAFSEEVQLYAKMLAEDSEEYSKAQDNLENSDTVGEYDGFVAMDIRFVSADLSTEELENAEEIEPDAEKGQVFVKIDAQAVLPENIDQSTVAVQHHAEVKDDGLLGTGLFAGTEIVVETVADGLIQTGKINVTPSMETAKMSLETDFGVESFSTFTITYARPQEPDTVTTVETSSKGINIGLFDYDEYSINNGHELKFSTGSEFYGFNKWTGSSEVYSNIVSDTLVNGYPTLNSDETGSSESLKYLFTNDYTGLDHLFQLDSEGYYYYDASQNFAELNEQGKVFTVYDEPSRVYNTGSKEPNVYFLPFNSINETNVDRANYHFGMSIDFNFVMPKNGQISTSNGSKQDMIFEFAGDDDVWVFIDGKLALDLGGIHNAASGSINFNTGEITVNDVPQKKTLWNLTGNGDKFTDYSTHTFNFFYLERGKGASNCKIKFNIQTIPSGSLVVGKNVENYFDGEVGKLSYTMQVAVDSELLANTEYTDLEGTSLGRTNENGQFNLEHGELVMFKGIAANANVTVTEVAVNDSSQTLDGSYDIDITVKNDDGDTIQAGSSGTVAMPPAGSVSVIVNNRAKFTAPVTVTKTFDGTTYDDAPADFEAEFIVYEVSGETSTEIGRVNYSDFDNDSYTFHLETTAEGKKYKIVEKVTSTGNTDKIIYRYTTVLLDGVDSTFNYDEGKGTEFVLSNDYSNGRSISFTNVYGGTTGDLSITKEVKRTDGATVDGNSFTFEILIQDLTGTFDTKYVSIDNPDVPLTDYPTTVTFTDGKATVTLKHNQKVTISDLPADKTATVTETTTDGYAVSWSGGTATSNDSNTVGVETALISTNPELTCTNTTGAMLPSTGGMGTKPFILLGIIFTFIAGGLLIVKYRKGDGGVI